MLEKHQKNLHIMVLEPHADDGIFSAGGFILNALKLGHKLISVCVFAKGGIEKIREQENRYVWETVLKSKTHFMNFLDAPYRTEVNNGKEIYSLLKQLYIDIDEIINNIQPDIILAPLGIGQHIDHLLTMQTITDIWKCKNNFEFYLYEDYPYCNQNRYSYIKGITDAFKQIKLTPTYVSIADVINDKVDLQMAYKSQHKYHRDQVLEMATKLAQAMSLEGILCGHTDINYADYSEKLWIPANDLQKSKGYGNS